MEENNKKQFYIIDGNAYVYRSFYAIKGLATSTGFPTNAIYGFVSLLLKILHENKPDYLAIAFDTQAPTFRHKEFAYYKADRPEMPDPLVQQFPIIKDILKAFNIAVIEQQGYEADDIIGTLAKKAEALGIDVVIVTGDKDALQLINENIKVRPYIVRGASDQNFIYDESEVEKRYGVAPNKITDLLGLMGDTSDSIPGIPGIGEKTAGELLTQFESLEDLIEHVDKVKNERRRELIKQYSDQAILSKRLATINVYVPIEVDFGNYKIEISSDGLPANCNRNELIELFKKLEFNKFLKEINLQEEQVKIDAEYKIIFSETDLDELVNKLKESSEFAIDTETSGLDPLTSDIVGISIAIRPHEAYYIPISHTYIGVPTQLSLELVIDKLKPILEDHNIGKIGQNIKYDLQVLRHYGIELSGITFDTMIASYVLNPSSRGHSLDNLAMTLLDHKMIPIEDLIGKGKDQINLSEVEIERVCNYSCEDADITLQLKNLMEPKLKQSELEGVFKGIELPLISVLADMEMTGVKIDTEWLDKLSIDLSKQLDDLTKEIYSLAGQEFNINSTQQLGDILFSKLKLPTGKKTKTGYSTNEAELKRLSDEGYELPSRILQYRTIAKLKSTYIDALPGYINPKTGRVHTTFNQAVTETGRLSSSNPNLQNIPIKTEEGKEIRRAFISEDGYLIMSVDYSQIELRMLAHLSKDPILIEAFNKGEDIHSSTAALIFGLPKDQITSDMRRKAKTVNFGIIYGISAFRLSKDLGISTSEAQEFIDSYFKTYFGVKTYLDEVLKFARKNGYVTTISGRRRFIPEICAQDKVQRESAERTAINTPVQGSAADLIKIAMINIANFIKSEKLSSRLILQIHDELVFEVLEDELEIMKSTVCSLMENSLTLDIPLKVDVGVGKNWLEAK